MHLAIDLDDTITIDPHFYATLGKLLINSGWTITILTASLEDEPTIVKQLSSLGMDGSYSQVVIVDQPASVTKPKFCKKHSVDALIDNRADTIAAVADVCLGLLAVDNNGDNT
jgi:hypothetical protein